MYDAFYDFLRKSDEAFATGLGLLKLTLGSLQEATLCHCQIPHNVSANNEIRSKYFAVAKSFF